MRLTLILPLLLLISTLNIQQIQARCWCVQFVRVRDSYWTRKVPTGCNDNELQEECRRAEWELTDWVGAVMAYARTLAQSHPENSTTQEALNQAALSYAVEAHRPVPDCATGLFTTTPLEGDNWEYLIEDDDDDGYTRGSCISNELLAECEKVRDGVEEYIQSVMSELRESEASQKFVDLMSIRIENSITPTIVCKTTTYAIAKISDLDTNAASMSYYPNLITLFLVAIINNCLIKTFIN